MLRKNPWFKNYKAFLQYIFSKKSLFYQRTQTRDVMSMYQQRLNHCKDGNKSLHGKKYFHRDPAWKRGVGLLVQILTVLGIPVRLVYSKYKYAEIKQCRTILKKSNSFYMRHKISLICRKKVNIHL